MCDKLLKSTIPQKHNNIILSVIIFLTKKRLNAIALNHSIYMANKGQLTHYDKNLRTPLQRMKSFGQVQGRTIEIVARIDSRIENLKDILIWLIIDDELDDRFNRKAILNYNWRNVGIGQGYTANWKYITILLTEDFVCKTICYQKTVEIYNQKNVVEFFKGLDIRNDEDDTFQEYFNNSDKDLELNIKYCEKKDESDQKQKSDNHDCQKYEKTPNPEGLKPKCQLCKKGMSLEIDGSCSYSHTCPGNCDYCRMENSVGSPAIEAKCQICSEGFLRLEDYKDGNCYHRDTEQIDLSPKIPNCRLQDYTDYPNNL